MPLSRDVMGTKRTCATAALVGLTLAGSKTLPALSCLSASSYAAWPHNAKPPFARSSSKTRSSLVVARLKAEAPSSGRRIIRYLLAP